MADDNGGFTRTAPAADTGGFTRTAPKDLFQEGVEIAGRSFLSARHAAIAGAADLAHTVAGPELNDQSPAWMRWLYSPMDSNNPIMHWMTSADLIPAAQGESVRGRAQQARQWLQSEDITPPKPRNPTEWAAQTGTGVVGGAPIGILDWYLGVPFAVSHGINSAEDHAEAHGRHATVGEMAYDAVLEGVVRKIAGGVAGRAIGALPTALSFGALFGGQDIAEQQQASAQSGEPFHMSQQDVQDQAVNIGVNMVMGFIGGHATAADHARMNAAMASARAGDMKGAMSHLDPVLVQHSDVIAAAARNLGIDVSVEPVSPPSERMTTPTTPGEVKTRARASLATRRASQERMDAVARARMAGWEEQWNKVPNADRMGALSAYQQGGVEAVRGSHPKFEGFFSDFEAIMKAQAALEHAAGLEYDVRDNYAAGYWHDPAKAELFYRADTKARSPMSVKPGFTQGKVFNDYLEGIQAGFRPKTTNPAVIAAMRVEQGNQAIARRLAIRDMVEDGLAIPTTEDAKAAAKAGSVKRREVKASEADRLVAAGMAREVSEENANRKAEGLEQIRGNVRAGGKEYSVTDEGLAQLNAAVKRVKNAAYTPREHRSWSSVDVGGSRYLVEPKAARMLSNAFEYGAKSLNAFGKIGAGVYSAWMAVRNISIPITLSMSAYHALHILGIDAAQPLAAAFKHAADKHMDVNTFVADVKDQWAAMGRETAGRRVSEDFERPDKELTPVERMEQNLMLAGGFSPRMPSYYEIRAGEEMRRALNDAIPSMRQEAEAQGWNAMRALGVGRELARVAFLNVGHVIEKLQGPLFNEFIPALKTASYLNEAKALLDAHPDLLAGTPEANGRMRAALREIADSMDNRFGQMQYDKLFWPRTVQRAMVATMLSAGWNLGFLREYGRGLTTDIASTVIGRKETRTVPGEPTAEGEATTTTETRRVHELHARTVYASTYMGIAAIVSGMMTYVLTGTPPKDAKDYIYPRLPDGTRLNTMWFSRELGAIFYHLRDAGAFDGGGVSRVKGAGEGALELVTSKMQEMIPAVSEALQNEDYFGNQIYDPNGSTVHQIEMGSLHIAGSLFMPISAQGVATHPGQSPDQAALGFGGFNPAGKYIERTPMQSRIQRAYKELFPHHVTAYGDVQRAEDKHQLRSLYDVWKRSQSDSDHEAFVDALANYQDKYRERVSARALTGIEKDFAKPEYASMFSRLDDGTQISLLKDMSPEERTMFEPFAHRTVREHPERYASPSPVQ